MKLRPHPPALSTPLRYCSLRHAQEALGCATTLWTDADAAIFNVGVGVDAFVGGGASGDADIAWSLPTQPPAEAGTRTELGGGG